MWDWCIVKAWLCKKPLDVDGFEEDEDLYTTVLEAWHGGFSLASDFAREYKEHVGIAASLGLISTRMPDGSYGRLCLSTEKGVRFINEQGRKNMEDL